MKTIFALTIVLCWLVVICHAQDTVVKTDKSEIKCVVNEVTQTHIKYKKWDFQNGPTYNISQNEVFMIIYSNGEIEKFKRVDIPPSITTSGTSENSTTKKSNRENTNDTVTDWNPSVADVSTEIDTTIDYKNLKVKYKPSRVMLGLGTPMDVGFEQEYRIVKNFFNLGAAYHILFPVDDYVINAKRSFFYGSTYLPINRIMGDYKNQDKGMYVYGHFGYLIYSATAKDSWGLYNTNISSGNFSYRVGVDYLFSNTFGISASTYEFKIFSLGIVASIL